MPAVNYQNQTFMVCSRIKLIVEEYEWTSVLPLKGYVNTVKSCWSVLAVNTMFKQQIPGQLIFVSWMSKKLSHAVLSSPDGFKDNFNIYHSGHTELNSLFSWRSFHLLCHTDWKIYNLKKKKSNTRTIWIHVETGPSSLTHKTFAGVWQANKTNTSLAEAAPLR